MMDRAWAKCIVGGLSTQAIIDFIHLWNTVSAIQLNDETDKTIWRWSANGTYTTKSAYRMLHVGSSPFLGHNLVWKTWAPLKVKIFLWLALRRRHWTADRRKRHGLDAQDHCYLCDQVEESIDHIIATCSYSRGVVQCAAGPGLPPAAGSANDIQGGGNACNRRSLQSDGREWTPSSRWYHCRFGKSGTLTALGARRQLSARFCKSSKQKEIAGLRPEQRGYEHLRMAS